jgi:biotin transporter BioY
LKDKFNYLTIAKADVLGVLTIHIIGVFYLILMSVIHQDPLANVISWITMQSGVRIIYDLIFGFFAILLAKPVKHILWLSMG